MKTFKLGIDIHGVIDDDPEFFSRLTQGLLHEVSSDRYSFEVHIITGAHKTEELVNKVKNTYNIMFTHFFSIADYHKDIGTTLWYDNKGTPWMEDEVWDRTKAEYCSRNSINLHIDDTERYGKYFTTPFSLYTKAMAI